MSYCQHCGEKNLPYISHCENCGAPLPVEEGERLQPGYGYDIHAVDCRHRLKIEPMLPMDKLSILGKETTLFVGNLLTMVLIALLLLTDVFRSSNPLLKDVVEESSGLFGPAGRFFTGLFFLLYLASFMMTLIPLYTRNTYNASQLIPAMVLELMIPLIALGALLSDFFFGSYMGTTLTINGCILLLLCAAALVLQYLLIREYKWLKKSGIYSYVAN